MKIIVPALLLVLGACGVDLGVGSPLRAPAREDATPTAPPKQPMTTKVMNVDELIVDRALMLTPHENLEIHARRVEIPATTQIAYHRDACDFSDSPSLTIIADEDVVIGGAIDLRGKDGVVTSTGCGTSDGTAGGSVSITADTIAITGAIRTGAGAAAQANAQDGASGGIALLAANTLTISGTVIANGGKLDWDAPHIVVNEPPTDDSRLANAVVVAMTTMNIVGTISSTDDIGSAKASDAISYTPQNGKPLRMADLYAMVNDTAKPINVKMSVNGSDLMQRPEIMVAKLQGGQWVVVSFEIMADVIAEPGIPYLIGVVDGETYVHDYALAITTS